MADNQYGPRQQICKGFQSSNALEALEATHEGLKKDKEKTQHPTIIPTNLLPKYKIPKHHKPDIIRAIGYKWNTQGQLVEDLTYKGRRCLQLIECKYSTDTINLDTITNIHNIYEPLKQAMMRHTRKNILQVQMIPIVISRTSNFHTRTLPEIARLISFQENPPDNLTYKSLPPHTINHHGNPCPRTRMAHTYVQGLQKHPHPMPEHNKASNNK
jgi:hypothetical protein